MGALLIAYSFEVDAVVGDVEHDLLQQLAFDRFDPGVQVPLGVARQDGTRRWARTGPVSTPLSTTITLAPVSVAPAASASRTAWAPGNSGR